MRDYYELIKGYIQREQSEGITDSIIVRDIPLYDKGFAVEEIVKQLIWFLRADDNITWLYNRDFMSEVGWEKRINRFSPMEGDTSLRFYLDEKEGNTLNLVVTQSKVDLLEEAPYWMVFYSLFHEVAYQWINRFHDYPKGELVYNFVDGFIVTDEGEIHLPVFEKGYSVEIADEAPAKLKVNDFKVKKQ